MTFWILFLLSLILIMGRYRWVIPQRWGVTEKTEYDVRFVIGIMILTVISAIRCHIGYDYDTYVELMSAIARGIIQSYDIIPFYVFKLAGSLHQPIIGFAFFSVLSGIFLALCADKYSVSRYETVMIYMCLFYLDSLAIMRQALAVLILLYGYQYVKDRKIIKYLIVCLFATMIHKYAIVGVAIYFIYNLPILFLAVLEVGGALIVMILKRIIADGVIDVPVSLVAYLFGSQTNGSGKMNLLLYVGFLCYCLLLWVIRYRNGIRPTEEMLSMFSVAATGIVFPFILGTHTGYRIALYFFIYLVLLIPKCHEYISLKTRQALMIPYYVYFVLYLIMSVSINESNAYVPYQTYWN